MDVKNPPSYVVDKSGIMIGTSVLQMGPWNMVATASITPATPVPILSIVSIEGMIFNDGSLVGYPITSSYRVIAAADIIITVAAGNITVTRKATGFFDSVDFDDAVQNRGTMVILYKL